MALVRREAHPTTLLPLPLPPAPCPTHCLAGAELYGDVRGHDGQDIGALLARVVEPLQRLVRVAALALQAASETHDVT